MPIKPIQLRQKEMAVLNGFDKGLNTKSSPRDIAPNELQQSNNAIISNPGLLQSSSDATSQGTATLIHTAKGNGAFLFTSQYDIGATSASWENPKEVIAYPDNASSVNAQIEFFTKSIGATGLPVEHGSSTYTAQGNDNAIDMGVDGAIEPVYYYVDGLLYVSDKLSVEGATNKTRPQVIQFVKEDRFGQSSTSGSNQTQLWVSEQASIHNTTDAIFQEINVAGTALGSMTAPGVAGEFIMTLAQFDSYSSTANVTSDGSNAVTLDGAIEFNATTLTVQASSGTATNNLDTGTIFYIGNEAMQVENKISSTQIQVSRNILGNASDLEHADNANLYTTTEESIVGGGWEEGDYEFTYSLVNYAGDESLPHKFNTELSSATIGSGKYFSDVGIQINVKNAFRQREKGLKIYTRKKGSNDRYILFLDVDYKRGVRRNLYEKYIVWTKSGTYGDDSSAYVKVENLKIKNPSLDTYESMNGYAQNEESVSIEKISRAYQADGTLNLANEAMDNSETGFDVDEGSSFAVNEYILVDNEIMKITGISTNTLTVTRGVASSTSVAHLDNAEIFKVEFGGYKGATICMRRAWIANVRKGGVHFEDRIYYSLPNRFSTFPDSFYLDIGVSDGDSFTGLESMGNYLLGFKKNKLYVINVSSTSDAGWYLEGEYHGMGCLSQESIVKTPFGICWVNNDGTYIFDGQTAPKELTFKLDDKTWRTNQLLKVPSIGYDNNFKQLCVVQDSAADTDMFVYDFLTQSWSISKCIGSNGISNFVEGYDGLYFLEYDSGNGKTINKINGFEGSLALDIKTKDIDFNNPGRVKKIFKIYVTARDGGAGTVLTLSYALDGSTSYTASNPPSSGQATINNTQYEVNAFTIDKNCESISLQLVSNGKININDISIEYRNTRKRPS